MKKAFFLLLILFISNIPSLYYGWYLRWDWIDALQHFLGGMFVAMFMSGYLKDRLKDDSFIKDLLIITGTTLFVGVIWEFSEYIANQTLIEPFYRWFEIRAYFMGDLNDTMSDLFLDTLGSLVFMALYFLRGRESQKIKTPIENVSNGST